VGINSVVMIVFAVMINNGSYDAFITGAAAEALAPIYEQLTGSASFIQLFAGIERLGSLTIHMGLSILVLYG
ncbi:YhfC family intramembrane metalloprotease, partial [Butyricicoccus sp. 1XD8-22]